MVLSAPPPYRTDWILSTDASRIESTLQISLSLSSDSASWPQIFPDRVKHQTSALSGPVRRPKSGRATYFPIQQIERRWLEIVLLANCGLQGRDCLNTLWFWICFGIRIRRHGLFISEDATLSWKLTVNNWYWTDSRQLRWRTHCRVLNPDWSIARVRDSRKSIKKKKNNLY
jgi:hypothetical protein